MTSLAWIAEFMGAILGIAILVIPAIIILSLRDRWRKKHSTKIQSESSSKQQSKISLFFRYTTDIFMISLGLATIILVPIFTHLFREDPNGLAVEFFPLDFIGFIYSIRNNVGSVKNLLYAIIGGVPILFLISYSLFYVITHLKHGRPILEFESKRKKDKIPKESKTFPLGITNIVMIFFSVVLIINVLYCLIISLLTYGKFYCLISLIATPIALKWYKVESKHDEERKTRIEKIIRYPRLWVSLGKGDKFYRLTLYLNTLFGLGCICGSILLAITIILWFGLNDEWPAFTSAFVHLLIMGGIILGILMTPLAELSFRDGGRK